VKIRKIQLRWVVINDTGREIIWTDDNAEAEDLRERIERLTKPINKPLTKQVTKPLTKIKHVAQEEINPRQAYGQISKWRAKEITEKEKRMIIYFFGSVWDRFLSRSTHVSVSRSVRTALHSDDPIFDLFVGGWRNDVFRKQVDLFFHRDDCRRFFV
jgi:hypothetical protein